MFVLSSNTAIPTLRGSRNPRPLLERAKRVAVLGLLVVLLAIVVPMWFDASVAQAVDFDTVKNQDGPMKDALQKFDSMSPGLKALIIFLGFIVGAITLIALRAIAPVLGYVGLAVFIGIGLGVGGAIAGAVI